jgi:hypothetical protein
MKFSGSYGKYWYHCSLHFDLLDFMLRKILRLCLGIAGKHLKTLVLCKCLYTVILIMAPIRQASLTLSDHDTRFHKGVQCWTLSPLMHLP